MTSTMLARPTVPQTVEVTYYVSPCTSYARPVCNSNCCVLKVVQAVRTAICMQHGSWHRLTSRIKCSLESAESRHKITVGLKQKFSSDVC